MITDFPPPRGKSAKAARSEFLRRAAEIPGIYVPSLYNVEYNQDGTVSSVAPAVPEAKPKVVRRIVSRVDLVGMDVVEVSPPYDHAEMTAALAHRCVLEALSALAAKKGA